MPGTDICTFLFSSCAAFRAVCKQIVSFDENKSSSEFIRNPAATHLPLLEVEVGVVLAGELPDLDEEVPEVVLEPRDVLVQVEEAGDGDLDLVVGEVGEGRLQ